MSSSGSSYAIINFNNIKSDVYSFALRIYGESWGPNSNDINGCYNYYYQNNNIANKIYDKFDVSEEFKPYTGYIIWDPFETEYIESIGIQGEKMRINEDIYKIFFAGSSRID